MVWNILPPRLRRFLFRVPETAVRTSGEDQSDSSTDPRANLVPPSSLRVSTPLIISWCSCFFQTCFHHFLHPMWTPLPLSLPPSLSPSLPPSLPLSVVPQINDCRDPPVRSGVRGAVLYPDGHLGRPVLLSLWVPVPRLCHPHHRLLRGRHRHDLLPTLWRGQSSSLTNVQYRDGHGTCM